MILGDLLRGIETKQILGPKHIEILGISYNSKEVRDGFLFVAVEGGKKDGHEYLKSAMENGARALLVERVPDDRLGDVSIIQVEDTRSSLAHVSANFFGHPTKELALVGVTGTNGKTTITYLLESIWQEEKKNAGIIGTVEYRFLGKKLPSPMTTPESLDLMRLFFDMRNSGIECVAMEVSSHALDRKRVLGCHFDAAVFTNLTQDHLDYHRTMENYFNAKKRLFTEVLERSEKKKKFSVINFDDPNGREIAKEAAGEIVSYSCGSREAMIYVEEGQITPRGIWAILQTPWGKIELNSQFYGRHNLSNLLAATATALSLGASKRAVEAGISKLASVPGRLDRVENSLGITVLVDYAHTPDALYNVLNAVKPFTSGNLILVFGCGGDRDPVKRPIMGKIGREISDILIVTSDNPRTESPEEIIDQIEKGVSEAGCDEKPYFKLTNRRDAIRRAIEIGMEGDTVIIAGKGHENYQVIGEKKLPFDDKEEARIAMEEKGRAAKNA